MVPQIVAMLAMFANARKILVGARLLVLAEFYKCSHARFLVKVGF